MNRLQAGTLRAVRYRSELRVLGNANFYFLLRALFFIKRRVFCSYTNYYEVIALPDTVLSFPEISEPDRESTDEETGPAFE